MTEKANFCWDSVPIKTAVTANPAAGANPAEVTVPAGKKWLLLGAYEAWVNAAAAADRYPALYVKHDGTNYDAIYSGGPSIISETYNVTFACGSAPVNASAGAGLIIVPLPANGIEIAAGGKFLVAITNINAGDDGNVLRYFYKEAPA